MESKSKKPSQARRAVLKGSLAAPVVLTVSTATWAANSATRALQQLKDQQPGRSLYFKDSPDNWVRRSVPVVKLKYKPNKEDKKDALSALSKDEWFYLDPEKNRYIKLSTMEWMSFGQILPSDWDTTKETSTRFLLVWVDPDTGAQSLKMQVEPKGGEIAATASAMGSFLRAAG